MHNLEKNTQPLQPPYKAIDNYRYLPDPKIEIMIIISMDILPWLIVQLSWFCFYWTINDDEISLDSRIRTIYLRKLNKGSSLKFAESFKHQKIVQREQRPKYSLDSDMRLFVKLRLKFWYFNPIEISHFLIISWF